MSPVLKLKKHDEKKEREFTLRCHLEYTPEQRIHMMLELSKRGFVMAGKYAAKKTYRIIQRS